MSKQELITELHKKGYTASLEGNIPMITLAAEQSPDMLRSVLKELRYNASFGYKKITMDSIPEPELQMELTTDKNGQYLLF